LALSDDGKALATADAVGVIKVWDMAELLADHHRLGH
jgi:hypothetical protein